MGQRLDNVAGHVGFTCWMSEERTGDDDGKAPGGAAIEPGDLAWAVEKAVVEGVFALLGVAGRGQGCWRGRCWSLWTGGDWCW